MPCKTLKMKKGKKDLPYGEPVSNHAVYAKLTETQWMYIRAKSLLDDRDVQDVIRILIEKTYDAEKKNGIDIIKTAKDYCLI